MSHEAIIAELRKETQLLTTRLRQQSKKNEKTNEMLVAVERERSLLKSEMTAALHRVEELRREKEQWRSEVKHRDREVQAQAKGLVELNRKLGEAKDTRPDSSRAADEVSSPASTHDLQRDNALLSTQLSRAEKDIASLQKQLAAEQARRADAASGLRLQLEHANTEVGKLRADNKRLTRQVQLMGGKRPSITFAPGAVGGLIPVSEAEAAAAAAAGTAASIVSPTSSPVGVTSPLALSSPVSLSASASSDAVLSPVSLSAASDASEPHAITASMSVPAGLRLDVLAASEGKGKPKVDLMRDRQRKYGTTGLSRARDAHFQEVKQRRAAHAAKFSSLPVAHPRVPAHGSGSASPGSPAGGPQTPTGRKLSAGARYLATRVDSQHDVKQQLQEKNKQIAALQTELKLLRLAASAAAAAAASASPGVAPGPVAPVSSPPASGAGSHADLTQRVKALEDQYAQVQNSYTQLQKTNTKLKAREANLSQMLEEAEKKAALPPPVVLPPTSSSGSAVVDGLRAEVSTLRSQGLMWRNRYEQEVKKQQDGGRPVRKGGDNKKWLAADKKTLIKEIGTLQSEVATLKFQVYYGENREVADMKMQLEDALHNNAQVAELQEQLRTSKEQHVEDWLFSGDMAESLAVARPVA